MVRQLFEESDTLKVVLRIDEVDENTLPINKIIHGDSFKFLRKLPDNCIDAVVTDPPYALEFMSQKWDREVPPVRFWKEVLRVMKPGAHLLSFFGTRTYHRGVVNIEDAGFEIRDMIQWLYGEGFSKGMDISKAIDKELGAYSERKVVGVGYSMPKMPAGDCIGGRLVGVEREILKITEPATPEAKEWQGWNTSLKPAAEIICWATKPLSAEHQYNILLCQLKERVRYVEESLKHIYVGLKEGKESTVAENVQMRQRNSTEERKTQIGKVEDSRGAMDISQSELQMVNTALNTISSWSNILDNLSDLVSKFTIRMESEMIIELKILNSLLSQITPESIIRDVSNLNGSQSLVSIVENLLNGVKAKLNAIHILSAQENVILKENGKSLYPNCEPIVLARKPLSEKNVAQNVLKWGVGGLNVDACRVGNSRPPTIYDPNKFKKWKEQDGCERTPSCNPDLDTNKGRFPANVILDEEAAKMLDEQASRFFYCAKAGRNERFAYCQDCDEVIPQKEWEKHKDHKLIFHTTVKPLKLMEYLVRLVTPPNGIVLDPFFGSGTTGIACLKQGFKFIGVEIDEMYCKIAAHRLKPHLSQLRLTDLV